MMQKKQDWAGEPCGHQIPGGQTPGLGRVRTEARTQRAGGQGRQGVHQLEVQSHGTTTARRQKPRREGAMQGGTSDPGREEAEARQPQGQARPRLNRG